MKERIKDKFLEIEKYLKELEEIIPSNLNTYKKDFKTRAACERYAEKIIEAIIDMAFLLIKESRFTVPENDLQALEILYKNKVITLDLAERLQDAKRMRNILAHEYGEIDDEIVFNALKNELGKDTKTFLRIIKRVLD